MAQLLTWSSSSPYAYAAPRYSVPSMWTQIAVASPPSTGEDELDMTYRLLLDSHKERLVFEKGNASEQVLRNHISTLNSYLLFNGKTMENRVGRELTADYLKQIKGYASLLSESGKRKTVADKLSILRSWKKTVDSVSRAAKLKPVAGISIFHKELRLAIAASGQTIEEIAKAINAYSTTLPRWIGGANVVKKGMPTLRRLECHLGMTRGFLESKLEYPRKNINVAVQMSKDKFIERNRVSLADPFHLPVAEVTPTLIAEWFSLLRYKTAEHTNIGPEGLERSTAGVWRTLPLDKLGHAFSINPFAITSPGFGCPSADMTFKFLRSYLGFLCKAPSDIASESGLGLPVDQVQTLAMLAIPEFVNAYLEFMKARSGRIVHTGHRVKAGIISCLIKIGDGYLRQQPVFSQKIELYAKGRTWDELCDQVHKVCKSWHKASIGNKSRDPKAPLAMLLSLVDPLKPFKTAIQKLDAAAANCAPGSAFQATYKRDALLLAVAIANPLRHRTFTITKFIPVGVSSDFETNLYQKEDGRWWLKFEKGDFKNDGSKEEDYNAPLPEQLNVRVEDYLEIYRPVLVRRNPTAPWLFPDMHGEKHKDVGHLISKIARNYIPEVSRLGIHGIRHIVATYFLKCNPEQYTVIAGLLHDSLATVLKHYAHGQTESALKANEQHLKDFYSGI